MILIFINFGRHSKLSSTVATSAPTAAHATTTRSDVARQWWDADGRGKRAAQAGEAEAPADRLLERATDAPRGVVHGQSVLEQGQAHRSGSDAAAHGKTDQDLVSKQAHEREEVQEGFRLVFCRTTTCYGVGRGRRGRLNWRNSLFTYLRDNKARDWSFLVHYLNISVYGLLQKGRLHSLGANTESVSPPRHLTPRAEVVRGSYFRIINNDKINASVFIIYFLL